MNFLLLVEFLHSMRQKINETQSTCFQNLLHQRKINLNANNVFVHPVVSILAIQRVYVAAATAATANLNSHATKNRSLNSKTERKQKF